MARLVPFKQADVSRAVKGAISGGMMIGRVEIDPATGRIVLSAQTDKAQAENPLDSWLKSHAS
ncbi:hypothetical protein [Pararhizobium gei]|uniref:hypothetical protein n=1 Tax=Pararhizobium gei TaxID=1395951 RepID=UPI0023DA9D21|nr:hypothetical protein [Rhizobium gei]